MSLNPTCPAGTSEDSASVDFASAMDVPVNSFESKLTPTINGLLRAAIRKCKIYIKVQWHVKISNPL